MAVAEHLAEVQRRIDLAAEEAGRSSSEIRLMPVTKFHPVERMIECAEAGYGYFGENRPQELFAKRQLLPDAQLVMIGNVQRNKAKLIAEAASELHSLDSLALAETLQRRLDALGRRLPVLIQVNTSGEAQKSGVAPENLLDFVAHLRPFDALELRGLMTIAVASPDGELVSRCFSRLGECQRRLRHAASEHDWRELSMGMSGDFELAIGQGATIVRVGTAIFGARGGGGRGTAAAPTLRGFRSGDEGCPR